MKNSISIKTIEETLDANRQALMSLPGVIGTGQGLCDDKPCIKVYVTETHNELELKIPNALNGYKVMIEIIGEIQAHSKQ